jgi:hypothetical protein
MSEPTLVRAFVKPDDSATITCPYCQQAKTVPVGKFRDQQHVLKVRCACGHSFTVSLDFRKHYRKKTILPGIYEITDAAHRKHWKKTQLSGVYTMQAPATGCGHMQVTNISLGGLQFKTPGSHSISIGQHAQVSFTLDDRKQTTIIKQVTVQSIDDKTIGCKFSDNQPLEQGLRFYLFP